MLGQGNPLIWIVPAKTVQQTAGPAGSGQVNTAKVEPVIVRLGVAVGDSIQVTDDVLADDHSIQADDFVVVRGNERIQPSRPGAPPSEVTWPVMTTASATP